MVLMVKFHEFLPHIDAPELKELGKGTPLILSLVRTLRASSLPGRTSLFSTRWGRAQALGQPHSSPGPLVLVFYADGLLDWGVGFLFF